MTQKHNKLTKLVICCCADYQLIKQETIRELYAAAVKTDIDVELCADFCFQTIDNPDKLKKLSESNTAVAACQPRAVTAFFSRVGVCAPEIIDIRNNSIENILGQINLEKASSVESIDVPTCSNDWKAWYPIIDPVQCTRCGKCVDFCFFGVYKKDDNRITVASPQNCKNNCPACARMCPQQAIMFPKHMDPLINGGVTAHLNKDLAQDVNKFDENLYQRLADRRRAQKKTTLLKE